MLSMVDRKDSGTSAEGLQELHTVMGEEHGQICKQGFQNRYSGVQEFSSPFLAPSWVGVEGGWLKHFKSQSGGCGTKGIQKIEGQREGTVASVLFDSG